MSLEFTRSFAVRRAIPNPSFSTGKLIVNLDAKTVEVDSARDHLTGKEYPCSASFLEEARRSRRKCSSIISMADGRAGTQVVDVFICKLRKKLSLACGGANYIETVWGRGYVLRDPEEVSDPAAGRSRLNLSTKIQTGNGGVAFRHLAIFMETAVRSVFRIPSARTPPTQASMRRRLRDGRVGRETIEVFALSVFSVHLRQPFPAGRSRGGAGCYMPFGSSLRPIAR